MYVCVRARDRQANTDRWVGRERARACRSVHTPNMFTVNQLIWKCPGGAGSSRAARLPQHDKEKPPLALPEPCWQTLHWLPSKLGNMCIPLSQRCPGTRHPVTNSRPAARQLRARLQCLSSSAPQASNEPLVSCRKNAVQSLPALENTIFCKFSSASCR